MRAPSQLPPIDDAFQAHLRALKAHKAATLVVVEGRNGFGGGGGGDGGSVAAKRPDGGSRSSSSSTGIGGSLADSNGEDGLDVLEDAGASSARAAPATISGSLFGSGGGGGVGGGGEGDAAGVAVEGVGVEVVTNNGDGNGHGVLATKRGSSLGGPLEAVSSGTAAAGAAAGTSGEDSTGGRTQGSCRTQGSLPSSGLAFMVSAPATDPSVKPPDKSE